MKISNEIIFGRENEIPFLVNKRTGDYYELDEKTENVINKIRSGKIIKNENLQLINNLKNEGIIVNEYQADDSLHIQWHLTERCNLKCSHCYQKNIETSELDIKEMKRFVDHFIYVLKKQGMGGSMSITGGEPLILGDKFWNLIQHIKSADLPIQTYVLTNGTLITSQIAKKLAKYNIGCQISFDGHNAKTHDNIRGKGNFLKALQGAKNVIAIGMPVSIHCVIMKQNVDHAKDMINFCIKNNFKRLTFSRLVLLGRGEKLKSQLLSPSEVKKAFKTIYYFTKKYNDKLSINTDRTLWCDIDKNIGGTCPAGFSTLVINTDGSVYPCRRLPIKVGNIIENSIFEIWYGSEVMKNLRDRGKIKKCGNCKLLEKCGGCRAIAYSYFGDYMAPDPQCWRLYKKLPPKTNF